MNLTESLLHALKEWGAREIFGIPGDFALPFFRVIEESGILPLYTLSHEPAVGFAADAAARYRGGLGVAAVTYGAGALNLVNPVAQAFAEKSPLAVISGAPGKAEISRGLLLHHQAKTIDSQLRIFQEITCDQAVLNDAATAPAAIARVLQNCREQSRPVYLELPRDMAQALCEPVPELPPTACDPEAVADCAESILARLSESRRPVLMVGVEVRRFGLEEKVKQLADRLGISVVTSFMGSGLLVGSSRLAGTYLGAAGDPRLSEAVENSDALLLFGVILSDTNFGISAGRIDMRRAIHLEGGQVRIGFHHYPNITLEALLDELLRRARPRPEQPGTLPRDSGETRYPSLPADDEPLAPDDVAAALNDLIAAHGPTPIASDMGDCLFATIGMRPTEIAAPGYYASMGFGVPAGLGIQATSGKRPIILVGDGAFQMTGMELGNCGRFGWDPIVLLLNNAAWGMLAVFEPQARYNDLESWNYTALAESLGGVGRKVRTRREFGAALQAALAARGRFQLIELVIPREKLSRTLNDYIDTIRQLQQPKAAPVN